MTLAEQMTAFAWTVIIGMFAGFCYQIYRVIRDGLKLRKWGTFAGDVFFGILLTVLSFALLLEANNGQFRLYVFVGLIIGIFLYVQFLNNISYQLIKKFFYLIGKLLSLVGLGLVYLWKTVVFPFKMIWLIIVYPIQLLGRLLGPVGKLAGRPVRRGKLVIFHWAEKVSRRFGPPRE